MEIKASDVKDLRDLTGAGMMEVKQALLEAGGDVERAKQILKDRGATIAAKKADRVAANGVIASYVHTGNQVGVLVEVKVETDFVARDEKFIAFAREVAIHIAGMDPKYIDKSEVSESELKEADDPDAYIKEVCLLEQSFVKMPDKTIRQLVEEQVALFKENIRISRFVRYELGVAPTC